jgi:hypothetical protein
LGLAAAFSFNTLCDFSRYATPFGIGYYLIREIFEPFWMDWFISLLPTCSSTSLKGPWDKLSKKAVLADLFVLPSYLDYSWHRWFHSVQLPIQPRFYPFPDFTGS